MHLTEEDRVAFCKVFWDNEKKRNPSGATPDEYSRESGDPYIMDVDVETYKKATPDEYSRESGDPYIMDVDVETYKKVKASKNGIWGDGNMPPAGKQGRTGFVTVK